MDEQTREALRELGWREELGRGESGPYLAFVRGSDHFHVTLDSRRDLVDERVEYAAGRTAKTVVLRERDR